jgi:hypothetical protein
MTAKEEELEDLAKQKVRAIHPAAFRSAKGTVWSERGTTKIRLGTTWQNAAESIPAQPAQKVCRHCDLPIRKTHLGRVRNEWEHMNGMSFCADGKHWAWPKDEHEPVAPVEAKEKDSFYLCFQHGKNPCSICHAIKNHVAEPKPTPSTHECPVCYYLMPEIPAEYNICPRCGTEFENDDADKTHEQLRRDWINAGAKFFFKGKPQPDSSSISTEQTFRSDEALLRDILSYCRSRPDNHPKFDIAIREACIKLQGFDPDIRAAAKGSTEVEGK